MRRHVLATLLLLVLPGLVWGQGALVVNGNRVHAGWVNYGTTSGTATAYTLAFMPPMPGYALGQCFLIKPHVTNTGPATLNVQSKGALPLTKRNPSGPQPLSAGDLVPPQLYQACYTGTTLQLMGTEPDGAGGGISDADKGDVTVTGGGTVWTIDPGVVTYAKIQNVTSGHLLGRATAGTGSVQELTAAQVKSMLGITFGDVTGDLPYTSLTPATAGSRLLGRGSTGAGDWQELTLGPGLAVSGTTLNTVEAGSAGIVCDGATQTAGAIQNAINSLPIGGKLRLPSGICLLNTTITISQPMVLEGIGIGLTQLRQTVPSIPVLVIDSQLVTVSGLFVTHAGVSPVAGGDGLVVMPLHDGIFLHHLMSQFNWRGFVLGSIAYGQARDLIASLNNSHGFEFLYDGYGGNQWDVAFSKSENNKGAGYAGNVGSFPQGLGPFLNQTTSFLNTQGGYVFIGSPGHTLFDVRLLNVLSSYDNQAGIYLETYGGAHIIDNPWIEFTGMAGTGLLTGADLTPFLPVPGHCMALSANNGHAISITGGNYINCGWSGIAIDASFVTFVGGASVDYGAALDPDPTRRAGVVIGGSNVLVSGHAFNYHAAFPLHYIYLKGSPAGLSIGHNTYNPSLDPSAFLGVDAAAAPSGGLASLIAGLAVHTNRVGAPALSLYDATNGPTPIKSLLVNAGRLEVRNSSGSAILSTLSDSGTPGWPSRRGQATISGTGTTATVLLTPNEPDTGYFVQVTPVSQVGAPATGAFTVQGVSKGPGNFVLTVLAAPGVGTSVTFDWFVYR